FSSRRRHTRCLSDWSSDVCSSDLSTLTGAGLRVTKQTQTVTDRNKDGVVISQNPNAGSNVTKGSTVTIVVGKFQQPTSSTTSSKIGRASCRERGEDAV